MVVQVPRDSVNSSKVDFREKSCTNSESRKYQTLFNNPKHFVPVQSTHQFNHFRTSHITNKMADTANAPTSSPSNTSSSTTNSVTSATTNSNSKSNTNSSSNNSTENHKTGNGTTVNLNANAGHNHTNKSASPVPLNFDECGLTFGSIVAVETCWNKKYEGEVISFNYSNKLLVLKCPATSGVTTRHDVHMINLNFIVNLEKKQNGRKDNGSHVELPDLKLKKLDERKSLAVSERKKLAAAFNQGVTEDGLRLFLHLTKTMGSSVTWSDKDIVVNENVCISHPYRKDNCKPAARFANNPEDAQSKKIQEAIDYVKKLLERFWAEN